MVRNPCPPPLCIRARDAALRSVLPAFHAITGCDTVSQFTGHDNVTAWKAFESNSQLLMGKETKDNAEKIVNYLTHQPSTQILTK